MPLGALFRRETTHFRVWAPKAQTIDVILSKGSQNPPQSLRKSPEGYFEGDVPDARPGDPYLFQIDNIHRLPDPASRYQPQGVHGPSEIVDLGAFAWSDQHWRGISSQNAVIYELHVGTFSPQGTFEGVRQRLPYLRDLGVTVVELMPVADFPGKRNWGYDGVSVYAPARVYGTPQDLQRLVNSAHELGLAIILDVVYNHLGPDGNYLGFFSDFYSSPTHKTRWGGALNFDGPMSGPVRDFFIENALQWIVDYHFDGLRFDATHAIVDESEPHLLTTITSRAREAATRDLLFIAEDNRRRKTIITETARGGWGMDAVFADDFHHQLRRRLAGDSEGYFQDYTGSIQEIALTLSNGWMVGPEDPTVEGTRPPQFVFFLQNHDQVGNRAFGERIHHQVDAATYRAISTLLLAAPQTPFLFMGQEWAASTPFLYFTDHEDYLGEKIIEGRRDEFKDFSHFMNPALRGAIPSPQDEKTFLRSRLNWDEAERWPGETVNKLYRTLLALRRSEPAFQSSDKNLFKVEVLTPSTMILKRYDRPGSGVALLVHLEGSETATVEGLDVEECLFSTEDSLFARDPLPPIVEKNEPPSTTFYFRRPGAFIYRLTRSKIPQGMDASASLTLNRSLP